jgi:hypothetical protein
MGTANNSTCVERLALNSQRMGKKTKKNTGRVSRDRSSLRKNLREDIN